MLWALIVAAIAIAATAATNLLSLILFGIIKPLHPCKLCTYTKAPL